MPDHYCPHCGQPIKVTVSFRQATVEKQSQKRTIITAQQKELATELWRVLYSIPPRARTIQQWADAIRRMMEVDGIKGERIAKALSWYKQHKGDQYVPVIESAGALRRKWLKLLAAAKRGGGMPEPRKNTGPTAGDQRAMSRLRQEYADILKYGVWLGDKQTALCRLADKAEDQFGKAFRYELEHMEKQ